MAHEVSLTWKRSFSETYVLKAYAVSLTSFNKTLAQDENIAYEKKKLQWYM